MLIFKKISYKNLLSSGNYITEIALNTSDLTIIVGSNGAGKSTILDALSFVLFNKPFRKINKNQLINTITKKNTLVEIEFDTASKNYRVRRGIKPNLFEIFENDVLIDQSAMNLDYQDFLEKNILKCNHKTFCQIVILGSSSYIPFLELTVPQRREVIENICNLEIISTMKANLKKVYSETEIEFQRLTNEKELILQKIKLIEENNSKIIGEKDVLIDSYKKKIEDKHSEINVVKKNIQEKNILINEIENVDDILSDTAKAVSLAESSLNDYKRQIHKNIEEIKFYKNNDTCTCCKQPIDLNFKNLIIEKITQDGNSLSETIITTESLIFENRSKYNEFQIEKAEIQRKIEKNNELISLVKRYESEINIWKSSIDELNKQKDSITDTTELKNRLTLVNFDIDISENTKKIQVALGRLLKDDGFKAKFIDDYMTLFNSHINKFLYEMNFMCEFYLDNEFNETIKSRYRDTFSYASFSEGEKLRINLAILFTWREIAKRKKAISTNILFFDEILDSSLDYDGINSLFNIIKHLTKGSNTFIISHNSDYKDNMDNKIEFKKIKGFSHIFEE